MVKKFREFLYEAKKLYNPDNISMWHGSGSGDLRGGASGLHLGTKQAATDALTSRIGHPVDGEWNGQREYSKTKLAGKMSNHRHTPHKDWHANGYMKGQLKKGKAKSGYYYRNEGEDFGSISVVVPGPNHIRKVER